MFLLLLLIVSFLHLSSSTIKFHYLVNVVRSETEALGKQNMRKIKHCFNFQKKETK